MAYHIDSSLFVADALQDAGVGLEARRGHFGFMCLGGKNAPRAEGSSSKLRALADAISAPTDILTNDGQIAPVFTYFGQFILHDISWASDPVPTIDAGTRDQITDSLSNRRTGLLDLDCVYGDASAAGSGTPANEAFGEKLVGLMRCPRDPAKMRTSMGDALQQDAPPTQAVDLPRLSQLLCTGERALTTQDLLSLSGDTRATFLNTQGAPRLDRAVLGDPRNDSHLFTAQLHLALLKLHNRIVDSCTDAWTLRDGRGAVYRWARREVRRIYQWLVVNVYLPTICDPTVLKRTLRMGAPAYRGFLTGNTPGEGGRLPIPLEFSAAAFRFSPTMMRAEYDWNHHYGRNEDGTENSSASFEQMRAMTGNGGMAGRGPGLPPAWQPDWSRLINGPTKAFPDRAARRIDTVLAPPLSRLPLEGHPQVEAEMRDIAREILEQGHALHLPSAQSCIEDLRPFGHKIRPLSAHELGCGPTGHAVSAGGFDQATPLWFYVLKEAEIRQEGARLGPLGSAVVAETLLGLLMNDPGSYWNTPGSDRGRWHPRDGVRPCGHPVTDLHRLFEATGSL